MNKKNLQLIWLGIGLIIAFGLWYIIFVPEAGNFWVKISLSTGVLAAYSLLSLFFTKERRADFNTDVRNLFTIRFSYILIGIGSAIVLYGVFWFGNWVLRFLFSGAGSHISNVYASKGELSGLVIALLLAFVTSPAEEIFWRGFIQRTLTEKWSPVTGLLVSVLFYSLVHIWTMNIPLLLAATVAGFMWGLIYMRVKSLVPVIISHALWSVAVFILLPFN